MVRFARKGGRGMSRRKTMGLVCGLVLGAASLHAAGPSNVVAQKQGPRALYVDDRMNPLGIDDPAPRFSWQIEDAKRGAHQTAYEIQVASSVEMLRQGKANVWDSGRIESGVSMNVKYAGPALEPSTRYHWRVKVWDAAGNPYPAWEDEFGWWETGLLKQEGWQAKWIGYETPEEAAVRHAPAVWIASPDAATLAAEKPKQQQTAYRRTINITKPIRSASLYATGQDTVSAWINGTQVLTADPLPPWEQMPWKKFVRADVGAKLSQGANAIAIETVHYVGQSRRRSACRCAADDRYAGRRVRRRQDRILRQWKRTGRPLSMRPMAGLQRLSTMAPGKPPWPGRSIPDQ